MNVKED